jgi:hypothetical protein
MRYFLGPLALLHLTACFFGPLSTATQRRYAYTVPARLAELPRVITPSQGGEDPRHCLAALFGKHRLDSGAHFVVALREDREGAMLGAWDDEEFEILTLELHSPVFGKRVPFPSPRDRLYYTAGSTAWAHLCMGVIGTSARGTIWLKRRWFGELAAELDFLIDVRHARYPDSVERRRLRRTVTLDRSTPDRLARAVTKHP